MATGHLRAFIGPTAGGCEDRIGTGPPRARTEVIYVDLGYWAISGSIHPKGDPASWGMNSSVFIEARWCRVYGTSDMSLQGYLD